MSLEAGSDNGGARGHPLQAQGGFPLEHLPPPWRNEGHQLASTFSTASLGLPEPLHSKRLVRWPLPAEPLVRLSGKKSTESASRGEEAEEERLPPLGEATDTLTGSRDLPQAIQDCHEISRYRFRAQSVHHTPAYLIEPQVFLLNKLLHKSSNEKHPSGHQGEGEGVGDAR